MKKVLIRIFCLLMAFQVLFASVGFAMYEHLCKISGKSKVTYIQPKRSCCASKVKMTNGSSKTTIKRAKCCSDLVTHYKVTPNASQGVNVDFHFPAFVWAIETPVSPAFAWVAQSVSFKIPHYYNTAPPLFGRERLIFIQSFLI